MIVFQQSPTVTQGGRAMVSTYNFESDSLLEQILIELKKNNLYMSIAYDAVIEDTEVE
jgi:hypothetical protein